MLANVFQFARTRAQKENLSNEGSNVPLDLVKAELWCCKADSKPSIISLGTSVSYIGTDGSSHTLGSITYNATIARTDREAARALVEWTWRRALRCRVGVKQVVSSGLSTTVLWFSRKKSGRWRRKVTERPSMLCEWKLPYGQSQLHDDAVQTTSASMCLSARDRLVAFMYNAVQTPSGSRW